MISTHQQLTGTFIFNLKVSLAQREIGKTSERIKFVFESKRNKGEVTSGTKKYGYDIVNRKFEINPSEAENIVNLYEYFLEVNGNVNQTYSYFIQHFPGKGKDALSSYLRDTAFIGKYKLYRKEIYLENYIPAIMDLELFNSVQNLLKVREKTFNKPVSSSLFSGLVFCNACKNRMTKKQDNRTKNRLMRYCCDNASRRKVGSMEYKCTNHNLIREDYIETFLLNNLRTLAQSHINKNKLLATHPQKDNSKEIKEIQNKIYKLKDLYLDDLIDKDTYKKDYEILTTQLNKLKTFQEIPKEKDISKLKNTINANFDEIYCSLTLEEKRTFWLNIINQIYVENGEIKEVTFL